LAEKGKPVRWRQSASTWSRSPAPSRIFANRDPRKYTSSVQNWVPLITPHSYDYNDIIPILIGPNEEPFSIHADFLVDKSRFFAAACSKKYLESDGIIRLREVSPDSFRLYLGWVYSHDLRFTSDPRHADKDKDEDDQAHPYEQAKFCELYLLADLLDDFKLRNKTMEILVTQMRSLPHPHTIWRVYERTASKSLMREMLVDKVIMRIDRSDFARDIGEYPPEFVQEVAIQLLHRDHGGSQEQFVARLPCHQDPVSDSA
jgi:hypothetical protein